MLRFRRRRRAPTRERFASDCHHRDLPSRSWLGVRGDDDNAYRSLQLLNNAVTRGLTVEYIRNPYNPAIEQAVLMWKTQMLDLMFGAGR